MSGRGPHFTATVDFSQVQRDVAVLEKRNESAVLSYGKLESSMTRTEVASRKFGSYLQTQFFPTFARLDDGVTKATRSFWSMEGAAKAVQSRLAPQAAAISGISAALGENAGQTGKVVAGAGQLAAAWAAGGPLGLAAAGLGIAVVQLTAHWDDLIKKQDEALERQFASANKVIDERKAVEGRLNKLRAKDGGPETAAQAYLRVQKEIDDAERRLAEGRASRDRAAWKNLPKTIEMLKEIQTLEATAAARRNAEKNKGAPGSPATIGDDGDPFASPVRDVFSMAMIEEDAREKARRIAIEKRLDDEQRAEDRVRDLKIAAEKSLADEIERIREEDREISMRKRLADEAEFAAAMMSLTQAALVAPMEAAVGQATGVFSSYIEMKIAGEKHAEEQATAAFLKGIGSQLVGIGTRSIFEGGAKLFNPVTVPVGVAEIAFGGTAIAAGLGLGAAGARVSAGIPSEPKSDSSGARDRGVGGLTSGGSRSGDGGGFTINITYAAAGPAPEQTGREVVRVVDTLRSRQGLQRDRMGPGAR